MATNDSLEEAGWEGSGWLATPLRTAAEEGHADELKLFIETGAAVNPRRATKVRRRLCTLPWNKDAARLSGC